MKLAIKESKEILDNLSMSFNKKEDELKEKESNLKQTEVKLSQKEQYLNKVEMNLKQIENKNNYNSNYKQGRNNRRDYYGNNYYDSF